MSHVIMLIVEIEMNDTSPTNIFKHIFVTYLGKFLSQFLILGLNVGHIFFPRKIPLLSLEFCGFYLEKTTETVGETKSKGGGHFH